MYVFISVIFFSTLSALKVPNTGPEYVPTKSFIWPKPEPEYVPTKGAIWPKPGPEYVPTKGAIWPKPHTQVLGNEVYTFDPTQFSVEITGHNCTILANRIYHHLDLIDKLVQLGNKYRDTDVEQKNDGVKKNYIQKLLVQLDKPCEEYPHLEMDETYILKVSSEAKLSSSSIWGILHGLESFSQLLHFADNFQEILIARMDVYDRPAYAHRGLLLDTARHFIPVEDILLTLDTLSFNKMNVFHWHLVDDQSFPYQSEAFPDLSARGAYHKSLVYSRRDVAAIVQHARERGIRVLPEFDVPGHTRSWGEAYPALLSEWRDGNVTGLGPMNPVRNTTYKLLREFFREVRDVFPDRFIHVGGDEVEHYYWRSSSETMSFLREHQQWDPSWLHAHFMARTLPLLLPRDVVVWQEVFDKGVPLLNSTVIQVWQSGTYGINPEWAMFKALRAKHRVLFSAFWYLDHLTKSFKDMLKVNPREMVSNYGLDTELENLIGGEACMWSELVDSTNLHSRVWPRASAVAERLWSGVSTEDESYTYRRAEEHVCRMRRRGVPASPALGPGYCLT